MLRNVLKEICTLSFFAIFYTGNENLQNFIENSDFGVSKKIWNQSFFFNPYERLGTENLWTYR